MIKTLAKAALRVLPASAEKRLRDLIYPYRGGSKFFRPYVVENKQMEGEVFDLLISDRIGRDWYDRPCINNPIWLEMRFARDRIISKGDVIFECGAHHGCSTILLSKWVGPAGRIVTFEPEPSNFSTLQRNVELNHLANVSARRAAVGAEDGELRFDVAGSSIATNGKGVAVPVVRLDDFADLNPTILKVDVEGFELDVLRGAKRILERRPKLHLEIHTDLLDRYGASVDAILELIHIEDYNAWIQWKDDQEPQPYNPEEPITSRVHLFAIPR